MRELNPDHAPTVHRGHKGQKKPVQRRDGLPLEESQDAEEPLGVRGGRLETQEIPRVRR